MGRWTTIDHDVRRKFDLTLNEYSIADSIYYLSRGGWCASKKVYLGEFIGISRQATTAIIKKLTAKGLVVKGKKGLKTTDKWDSEILSTKPVQQENQDKKSVNSGTECKESCHANDKKLDTECKESCHANDKKLDTECKESCHHNIYSIDTLINTDILAGKSAEPDIDPAVYFHNKLIKTFYAGYENIYNEKLIFSKKEIGCIYILIKTKISKYNTSELQKDVTKRKIELLRQIAELRNPFQNWQFLPSQLLMYWDRLVDGCVQNKKRNSDKDFKNNLEYWKKLEAETEETNASH